MKRRDRSNDDSEFPRIYVIGGFGHWLAGDRSTAGMTGMFDERIPKRTVLPRLESPRPSRP